MSRIKYSYKSYRYSKRATDYHHLASLILTIALPAAIFLPIAVVAFALNGDIDEEFFEILVGAIASIVYVVLYFTVIDRKIEAIALEDYKKWQKKHNAD